MRSIVVINHMSLDGVMQSPGGREEDTRGGFTHGGWAMPGNDEVMARELGKGMAEGGPLLFGRRTYEQFHGYWPTQRDNPVSEVLDRAEKYVASTTLREPLPWVNSTLLGGDVPAAVAELKAQPGKDIGILGSGVLIRSLMAHELIDRFLLLIHPLVLGSGTRMFPDAGPLARFQLADCIPTTTGVLMATYERA